MNVSGDPGSATAGPAAGWAAAGPAAAAVPPVPPVALAGMRLRHLSCFVAVAQERTLARAAARLHLSQPAVSKTLAELERMAGAHLVDRGRAGTSLTAAGEQFLRYAAEVTQAMDAAAAALSGGAVQAVTVHVGALYTVADGLLARAIARLDARCPDVACTVRLAHNPELLDALTAGELDFAVGRIAEPSMMRGVSFELLYAEAVAVVARPGHPLLGPGGGDGGILRSSPGEIAADGLVTPRALLRYLVLIPEAGTAPRLQAEGIFAAAGLAMPARRVETQSSSVARSLTLLSDAVWITPARAVALDVERGWLSRVNVPVPAAAEPVGLLSRSGGRPGEVAEALMGILRELA
jgi:DNA-binding transcriptional LysR family regulator